MLRRAMVVLALVGCVPDGAPTSGASSDRTLTVSLNGGSQVTVRGNNPGVPAVDDPNPAVVGEWRGRWVAEKANPQADCPQPDAGQPYRPEPLFDRITQPQGLSRFCVYESLSAAFLAAPFVNPGASGLIDIGPDHSVVAVHGRLTNLYADSYRDMFMLGAGRIAAMGPQVGPRTRIALLDSSPTSPPGTGPMSRGNDLHGFYLANQMEQLTCNGSNCVGAISTRLALDLSRDSLDRIVRDPGGGDFGSLLGLAEAIEDEVADWVSASVPGQNLVLNLSLGWHPSYGGRGPDPALWPIDVRAVHSALVEAACRGVVVVAAAGNESGGAHDDAMKPIFPAAWAELEIDATKCSDHVGAGGNPPFAIGGGATSRPLLWAVGGVDEQNLDLSISRPETRPTLVAYGDHATVQVQDLTGRRINTVPLTGTSVSTAVVSAAAAAVWENLPDLTPDEVMDAVYGGGEPVGSEGSFWCPVALGGGGAACREAHRVEVCEAVSYACDTAYPGQCDRHLGASCANPGVREPEPRSANGLQRWTSRTPAISLDAYMSDSSPACGADVLWAATPWHAENPCPDKQFYAAGPTRPHTLPQPHHAGCPVCTINLTTGEIFLEQEESFSQVDSLTLSLSDSGGLVDAYTTTSVPPTNTVAYTISPAAIAGTVSAKVTAMINGEAYISSLDVID